MRFPSPPQDSSLYGCEVRDVEPAEAGPRALPPCPVCDAAEAVPRFAIPDLALQVLACVRCGLGRLHPLPDDAQIATWYPPHYYGDLGRKFQGPVEALVRLVGARHVRFLASGLAPGSRILDVGCGRGVLLSALADRGLEPHGFEISAEAARGADRRAEIRVAPDLRAARYPAESFDAVILWHVLEHVRDPAATLAEVHRVLRPGARLVVAVPNFSSLQARWAGSAWFHLDLPRHLYQFTLAALRRLIGRHGFEIRSEHHFSLRQDPFGWIQSWLNRRTDLPRNGLYTLLHRHGDAPVPFDARTRRRLWAALVLGAPPALVATLATTALRSGATVHVVARRR